MVIRMLLWFVGSNCERVVFFLVQELALNSALMVMAGVFLCLALKSSSRDFFWRPPSNALVVALAAGAGAISPYVKSGQWFVRSWEHRFGISSRFEIDANVLVALLLSAALWAFYAYRRRMAVTAPGIAGEAPAGA